MDDRLIIILLPAHNESLCIEALLGEIKAEMSNLGLRFEIAVCNDGSYDDTHEILNRLKGSFPLHIIEHELNRGLGETMRDLYEYAATRVTDKDIIVRMDCDASHKPDYIAHMIEKIDEGNDVVIASRFAKGGGQLGVPANRAFISRCANLFMKCMFPIKGVWEYSCGYRAYRAEVIIQAIEFYGNDFIRLKGLGFTCTLEKLIKLKILQASFAEIPFILRYDQKLSESKMVGSVTTLGYLVMALLYHWPWGGWRQSYTKKLKSSSK